MRYSQKLLLSIAAAVVFGLLGVSVYFVARSAYQQRHPLSNPEFGFQFLKPTQLPDGFRITASRIQVSSEAGKIYGIGAEMDLRTVDWVYEIQESRHSNEDIYTGLRNFDPESTHPTCTQGYALRQPYRLCHWIDYGTISVYEVESIQNGVFIRTTFPASLHQIIPQSAFDAYVASFKPTTAPKDIVSGI